MFLQLVSLSNQSLSSPLSSWAHLTHTSLSSQRVTIQTPPYRKKTKTAGKHFVYFCNMHLVHLIHSLPNNVIETCFYLKTFFKIVESLRFICMAVIKFFNVNILLS